MGILDLLEEQICGSKDKWTHIAILNKGKVRYYIARDSSAKKNLVKTLSSYSVKHNLFSNLINLVPICVLSKVNKANFVKLNLDKRIENFINKNVIKNKYSYNVIIGTYGEHQKIVIQLFNETGIRYCKIGNENTAKQMNAEIEFLKCSNLKEFKTLELPTYVNSYRIDGINMLITKEFNGEKVYPNLNGAIYELFKEVISIKRSIVNKNGSTMTFSHGDFAPWNMRKEGKKIIIFDWEYCGMRFYGFDIIHYSYEIQKLLNGKDHCDALEIAIKEAKKKDENLRHITDDKLTELYEEEYKKTFGNMILI
ncbi:phosphotransferase family protein [Clostridium sp.]|uniref:phosphotransferase family protein n=1 Tax=Clostridium sp. TaxID=1506 RepID=UPI003D6D3A2B